MSPAQTYLAHNCVQRLQHTMRTLRAIGVNRPSEITLPIEELECLAIAASKELGIDPHQFDVDGWPEEAGARGTSHESRGEIEPRTEWHIPT